MSFKFNIGDVVTVLSGTGIPDYTRGWYSEMEFRVGYTAPIIDRDEFSNGTHGYRLKDDIIAYTYDERGLTYAKGFYTLTSDRYLTINGDSRYFTTFHYQGTPTQPMVEEIEGGEPIAPSEQFMLVDNKKVKVSRIIEHPELFYICPDCRNIHFITSETIKRFDGKYVCDRCIETDYRVCSKCGKYHYEWATHMTYDDNYNPLGIICDSCSRELGYHLCDDCGALYAPSVEMIYAHDGWGDEIVICPACDVHYQTCSCCNTRRHEARMRFNSRLNEWFCPDCYEEPPRNIHGYHHASRSALKKHGVGPCYIGVELEVECEGSDDYDRNLTAGEVIQMLNKQVYCERDGSLSDGFEIITEPHTPEEFYKLKWREVLDYLRENNYTSHNNGDCGLHIHFSNEWFGDDYDEVDDNVAKVVHLYSEHYKFFLRCSRRTERQANEWARRYVAENFSDAKWNKDCCKGHHVAVNLQNMDSFHTVEFRLGRGTLLYDSFMAWIDMHLAIVRNARDIEPDDMNLSKWLKGISEATKAYIKERTDIDVDALESEVA